MDSLLQEVAAVASIKVCTFYDIFMYLIDLLSKLNISLVNLNGETLFFQKHNLKSNWGYCPTQDYFNAK